MIALFFKTYWKEVIIGSLIIGFVWYWNGLLNDRTELIQTNVKLDQMKTSIDSYQKTLDELKALGIEQQKRLDKSIETSNGIGKKFDQQITSIWLQKPPKDCQGAVKWFVDTKDDLVWPTSK